MLEAILKEPFRDAAKSWEAQLLLGFELGPKEGEQPRPDLALSRVRQDLTIPQSVVGPSNHKRRPVNCREQALTLKTPRASPAPQRAGQGAGVEVRAHQFASCTVFKTIDHGFGPMCIMKKRSTDVCSRSTAVWSS